jgi:putative membrane protein
VAALGVLVALFGATLTAAKADGGKRHHDGDRNKSGQQSSQQSSQQSGDQQSSDQQSSQTSSTVCGLDVVWLKMSIEGDRFEIAGGTIALQKTSNPKVKELAQTLIKDHTKSLQDSIDLANKLGIEVPSEPSPTQQWQLEELREMQGAEFDHDYAELEVADHIQDIDEAKDEVELGCNWDVRDEAKDEIPVLQYHLQLAQEAYQSAGSEWGNSGSNG